MAAKYRIDYTQMDGSFDMTTIICIDFGDNVLWTKFWQYYRLSGWGGGGGGGITNHCYVTSVGITY